MIVNAEQPLTGGVRVETQPLITKVATKSSVNFVTVELADIVPYFLSNLRRLGESV